MQTEQALQFHKHLLDAVTEAVIATDLDGAVTYWNRGAEQLYGWPSNKVLGRDLLGLLPADGARDQAVDMLGKPRTEERWSNELLVQRSDGSTFPAMINAAPIYDEHGAVIGIATVSADITERKQAETERARLTHHLGERVKELTALHGIAQVLQAEGMTRSEVLQAVIPLLAVVWQYPEITGVRISFDGVEYRTPNFQETPWKQESVVPTSDGRLCRVEIVYLEERPEASEGPFLSEERDLLDSVGAMLASYFERREKTDALRESEARFRTIFVSSGIGMAILNLEGRIIEANTAFQDMLGYSAGELRGMELSRVTHPEDESADLRRFKALAAGQRDNLHAEKRFLRKDGRTAWGRLTATLVRSADGEPRFTIGMVEDIAERKRVELALQASEDRLRASYAAVGQVMMAPDGHILKANPAFCEITDYDERELLDTDIHSLTHPDDRTYGAEALRQLLDGQELRHAVEKRYVRKDGETVTVLVSTSVIRDSEGNPASMISFVQDISERKRFEQQLEVQYAVGRILVDAESLDEAAPRILQAIAEGLHWTLGALWMVDRQDNRLRCVATWHSPSMQVGVFEAVSRQTALPSGIGLPGRVLASGEPAWIVDVLQDENFPRLHIAAREDLHGAFGFPIRGEHGILGVIEIFTRQMSPVDEDLIQTVTALGIQIGQFIERKRAEEELAARVADLARSNRDLAQFAYVASHDLQEPLRMVSSFTQLLAKRYSGKLDEEADEFISYAVDGASWMQGLINDLLAYSRGGTRGKPLAPAAIDAVLDRALGNLQKTVEETAAEIVRDPLPTVLGDDAQLVQLFQNLLSNAMKFRGERVPRIKIRAERTSTGKEWIFSIQDNGIGIDPQYAEQVFVIFQRLHTRTEYPGTGIGLAICKKIVERHGGRIWVESEPGQGTTFFFALPGTEEEEE